MSDPPARPLDSEAPASAQIETPASLPIPLFDERFRWVMRSALGQLSSEARQELEDPDALESAYRMLSRKVQQEVRRLDLVKNITPAQVMGIARSEVVLSTMARAVLYLVEQDADDEQEDEQDGEG
jgi:hypothetical protein